MNNPAAHRPVFLRLPQVSRALGIGRSALYDYMQAGILPRPVKIGRNSLWIESEIAAIAAAIVRGATTEELASVTAHLIAVRKAKQ